MVANIYIFMDTHIYRRCLKLGAHTVYRCREEKGKNRSETHRLRETHQCKMAFRLSGHEMGMKCIINVFHI